MSSSKEMTGLLWDEFFRNPSQFWDTRNTKRSFNSPDFRHKLTGKALWINGWYNPPWVSVKLQSTKLPPLEFYKDYSDVIYRIKSCGKDKDTLGIKRMHADNVWISQDTYIATTLIRAYAKCGALKEAQEVFDQLPERNVASWNALIAGYVGQGFGEEALKCYREMENDTFIADAVTYICSLKACAIVGNVDIVEEIHAQVRKQGLLKRNAILGNTLVNAYAKCGALKKAREVFDQLPEQNVVSWSILISGYADQGLGEEALACFTEMKNDSVAPNTITYICCLKACVIVASIEIVEEIHVQVREQDLLNKDIVLGNALINAYAECGALNKACEVFDQIPKRDVVSWNTLISGYADQGFGEEALECFRDMEIDRVIPNMVTYICVLKALGILASIENVDKIHAKVKRKGLLQNIVMGTSLVNAYAKCGALKKARGVFDQLVERDVVSWSALIGGYTDHGFGEEAIACFNEMVNDGVAPNSVAYICTLKACGIVQSLDVVEGIHARLRERELLKYDVAVGNALVNAYFKCGALKKARKVFDQLTKKDIASWNTLITGYVDQGLGKEAVACFKEIEHDKEAPDSVTYICVLKACSIAGYLDTVEEIFAKLREQGSLRNDVVLGNSLINAYAKCGALQKAREVFYELPERNMASWNILMFGYVDQGFCEEALTCFREMENDVMDPDTLTYICSLKACAILGSLEVVKEIHCKLRELKFLKDNVELGNTLFNAYVKCGALKESQEVFDQLGEKNVSSWNILLAGYMQTGQLSQMLDSFTRMMTEGMVPDLITFLNLLNGCNHGALLEDGQRFFDMIGTYGLLPTPEHYTCMVDLFGRTGQFDKAKCFVIDDVRTLLTFLGACQKWLNTHLAKWAFEKLIQLDPECASAYVCMANIYVAADKMEDANGIEFLRMKEKTWNIQNGKTLLL